MTHWKALVGGEYISALELGDKPATLTITGAVGVTFQSENGKTEKKAAISFAGTERKWAAGVEACMLLAALFGQHHESWAGHRVTLARVPVQLAGKDVDGVRPIGSPELTEPKTVTIKLARKKPKQVTLIPTGKGKAPAVDPDTGEVKP